MNNSVKEQLSACLDGELAEAELELLLKRVAREPELRDAMGRYALIREALRGGQPAVAGKAFAANIMAALASEPVSVRSGLRVASAVVSRLRPLAGFAVAAGVAAVAVLSVQQAGLAPAVVADNETVAAPETLAATEESSYTVPTTISTSAFVPATRLTNYVVAHSEYSSPLGRRTVLSSVLSDDDAVLNAPVDVAPTVEMQVTHP